jgi:predicted metal-dependent hydrolase
MPMLDVCPPNLVNNLESDLGFEYKIIESRRKTAAIHVTPKGVQVRIPVGVDHEWARDFLASKKNWVSNKLSQQQGHIQRVPKIELGSQILFLGTWRTLRYQPSTRGVLQIESGEIVFLARKEPTPSQMIATLTAYFKWQAKEHMVQKTSQVVLQIHQQDQFQQVAFRRTKSKWGHCTSTGKIQYNWLIMGAPLRVIEYLICHEVCHLQELNHSRQFWNLVRSVCPDYKVQQQWLKDNSLELSWC